MRAEAMNCMAIVDMRPNERDSSSNMRVRLIHQIFEFVHATDLCATIFQDWKQLLFNLRSISKTIIQFV